MKQTTLLILTVAALTAAPSLQAQDAKPGTEPATAPTAKPASPKRDRLENLKTQLNLTPEQLEKIQPIIEKERAQLQAVQDDKTLSVTARTAKATEIARATRNEFWPLLTPDQQEKWKAFKKAGAKSTPPKPPVK